ncbi:MAG: hypothetical protein L6Q83_10525 [Gammaproteobacteria bacterium]|jgi:hypothetical protein|nr:hypothetical protein [Gammaproteobacteria bacterium]
MASSYSTDSPFDEAAERVIDLGNRMLDQDSGADTWEIASGLLAGAVQFWLFSRQPCEDPFCESCAMVSTAERRLKALIDEARQLAEDSDYYASPRDINAGSA